MSYYALLFIQSGLLLRYSTLEKVIVFTFSIAVANY